MRRLSGLIFLQRQQRAESTAEIAAEMEQLKEEAAAAKGLREELQEAKASQAVAKRYGKVCTTRCHAAVLTP